MMAIAHPNAEAGILKFMNNVRFSLATDPGRQLVEEYVQAYGFKFLDGYLQNVLAGPQRDGIVDVLKTPGRKKYVRPSDQKDSGEGPAKRTSWLIKAREAKAMDDGMKGGVTKGPQVTGGTKRKSGDMLDAAITTDQREKKNKIAKLADNSLGVVDERDVDSEKGSMRRPGQSKSPFYAAAASALAEARAAAEARVTERERKELCEGTSPVFVGLTESRSSPFVQVPQDLAVSGTLEMDVDPVDFVDLALHEEIPVDVGLAPDEEIPVEDVGLAPEEEIPVEDVDLAPDEEIPVEDVDLAPDEEIPVEDVDLALEEEIPVEKSTVSLVDPKDDLLARTQSQLSVVSSTQSNIGILGHASKFVSSVLGGSKKSKPEVKSLQLAAVAAKKQQEEKDKKATRMREMENRRQIAIQRKVEDEKARAADEERKLREEGERRRREREELADKRPTSRLGKKPDDDNTKKRKFIADVDERPEAKNNPSNRERTNDLTASQLMKPSLNTSTSAKLPTKSALKQPTPVLASSAAFNTVVSMASSAPAKVFTAPEKAHKPPGSLASSISAGLKGKQSAKVKVPDEEAVQPSQVVQTQMAARAKAKMQASRQKSAVPSENIELPDINSEYSCSEDEDRPRTFDPPGWAQSPELRQALQEQSTVNPDDIFGAIKPLRMEEMFRTRHSRFRARSSSANWTGTDRLTVEEEREYARRMGFR